MSFDFNLLPENPILASTVYEQAELYRNQGNLEEAIALYQKTIELDPNFSWAYHQLGDIFSQQNKWTEAIVVYRQAIALNPNFSWSYHNLGTALSQQKQSDQAILAYSKAIELNPEFCWSYYYLGEAFDRQQNQQEAVVAYFNAWKQNRDLLESLNRIAEVLQSQIKQGLDSVINEYCSVVNKPDNSKFLPTDVELYIKVAEILNQNKHELAALIFYHIALKIQPNNLDISPKINAILEQKKALEQAIEQCLSAVQINPNDPQAYYNLGMALFRNQQQDEAVCAYLKFLELKPDIFLWNYQNIVDLIAAQNQLKTAINIYHQEIEINPESSIVYLNLAVLYTSQGDLKSAIEYNHIAGQKIIPKFRPQWQNIEQILQPVNHLDYVIIGTQKGGTTSLNYYLSEHPNIISSMIKEMPFWSNQVDRGLEWYFSHFPPIPPGYNCLVGEATPLNFNHPEVPENLVKVFPNVKLILLLRNPIDRAVSHYYHWLSLKWELHSLEEAMELELEQLQDQTIDFWTKLTHPQFQGYLAKGLYIHFLEKWMKIFPREQFLILKSEDFYANPDRGTTQVLQFLGLPEYHLSKYHQYNTRPYPPLSKSTRALLKDYFQPYNQQLEDFLGIRLNWN
ncbi:putative deacetylase sulfotransferase [Planktothrix serta PCC 8927]|uniref:Deacetylase sulfotransferase n=1 Tax=Planktothrix serta PCC 8927 TaxID=671068 RepID=A0A7Z9BWI0_9CYAN|nr:tetratricopeptide repeat-containing sulfotransferase family protein [Planktothrix serta]VXD22700.1 putative deacetylase sulfotransferase [Planktothrix serta PCC 8927]